MAPEREFPLPPSTTARGWQLPAPLNDPEGFRRGLGVELSRQLPLELTVLLQRRGYDTAEAILELLEPPCAPPPRAHFPELAWATDRLLSSWNGSAPGLWRRFRVVRRTATA
jgi:single-stranded-DNA-specific exonuclease